MARCYLTGLEIKLEDSYVLDRSAAQRLLRRLKQRLEVLQRLVDQFGAYDVPADVRKADYQGSRKDRRILSRVIAESLGAAYPEVQLFIPWTTWRERGRAFWETMLRDHPQYGAQVRGLTGAELNTVISLGRELMGRLSRRFNLSFELRLALLGAVCVRLRHYPIEEILEALDEGTGAASLAELGLPAHLHSSLRAALGAYRGRRQHSPSSDPGSRVAGQGATQPKCDP
jgi:hypothetical protein